MKKLNLNEEFSLEGIIYLFAKNEDKIYLKRLREGKSKPSFSPPTKQEMVVYFNSKGYTSQSAEKAFEYYSIADWKDSKGSPVLNWKQKVMMVWFRDENKITKEEPKGIAFFQK